MEVTLMQQQQNTATATIASLLAKINSVNPNCLTSVAGRRLLSDPCNQVSPLVGSGNQNSMIVAFLVVAASTAVVTF